MSDRCSKLSPHDFAVCGLPFVFGWLCVAAWTGSAPEARFEVGQRWQYRHEGPRPGSIEPNMIDGARILWVVSTSEEQGATRWAIEERFTNDKKVSGRLLVDRAGLLTALEIENEKGEMARLRYDPPIPYQPADMNVAEVRTLRTVLRTESPSFALPITTVVERLADETVVTPAGEFPGCSHYKSTTKSIVDVKIAKIRVSEERERWYHPSAHGMVKEVYRKGPVRFLGWSREGYTATSILTAYGREEVTAETRTPPAVADNNRAASSGSPSRTSRRWNVLLLVVGAVIFVVAVRGYARWRRESTRHGTL